jgi:hypothetical protein
MYNQLLEEQKKNAEERYNYFKDKEANE